MNEPKDKIDHLVIAQECVGGNAHFALSTDRAVAHALVDIAESLQELNEKLDLIYGVLSTRLPSL